MKHPSKVWSYFFNSYLIFLLIVMVAMTFVQSLSYRVFQDDIINKNALILDNIKKTFDMRFKEISNLGFVLNSNDDYIDYYLGKKNSLKDIIRLVENLRVLKNTNEIINDISIVYPENDKVISTSGIFTIRHHWRLTHEYNSDAYNNYLLMLEQDHIANYVIQKDIPNSKVPVYNIYFYNTFNINNIKQAPFLIISIDILSMEDMMEWIVTPNTECFAILNNDNQPVVISGNVELFEQIFNKLPETYNEIHTTELGNAYVSQVSSSYYDLIYMSVSTTSDQFSVLNTVRKLIIYGALTIFILGFLISIFFTKRTQKPLNIITEELGSNNIIMTNKEAYKYIQSNIEKLKEENFSISQKLNAQKSLLRKNFINKLILGEINIETEFKCLCKQCDIEISGNYNCVFILFLGGVSPVTETTLSSLDEYERILTAAIISSAKEITGETIGVELTNLNELYTLWLTIDKVYSYDILKNYAQNLTKNIHSKYGVDIGVARGNIYENYNRIALSYSEALQALEVMIEDNGCRYLNYSNILKCEKRKHLELLSKYVNCLKLQDYENAIILCRELFDIYLSDDIRSFKRNHHYSTLISITLDAIEDANEYYNHHDISECYFELSQLENDKLYEAVHKILNDIMISKKEKEEKDFSRHLFVFKDFIDKNYANPALGLSMMSDYFNMNNSYLSKLFKKEHHIGVLNYINQVRIEKAKQLLLKSDVKIAQISKSVGYISDITLIRVFKRYEGTTPGRYRNNYLK